MLLCAGSMAAGLGWADITADVCDSGGTATALKLGDMASEARDPRRVEKDEEWICCVEREPGVGSGGIDGNDIWERSEFGVISSTTAVPEIED